MPPIYGSEPFMMLWAILYMSVTSEAWLAWFGQLGRDAHRLLALAIVTGASYVVKRRRRYVERGASCTAMESIAATGLFRPMLLNPIVLRFGHRAGVPLGRLITESYQRREWLLKRKSYERG